MADYRLADAEAKFAALIWENAPMNSTELVRLSQDVMKWKKSTTYTVLKRLCSKGLFKVEDAVVSALISREAYLSEQSRRYVEDTFGGSLPYFFAAFIGGKKLSGKQAEELIRLIAEHKEG
ncbi:MAG: BlaI/MecI/CopY family transcriptional regulator [Oscillospiraceae bacterium]|jgi:predicted transcriptional regulator|nr:BlaI/MecI/CopY family transcriptional regulator [Oscillospiraceae bacterium]